MLLILKGLVLEKQYKKWQNFSSLDEPGSRLTVLAFSHIFTFLFFLSLLASSMVTASAPVQSTLCHLTPHPDGGDRRGPNVCAIPRFL